MRGQAVAALILATLAPSAARAQRQESVLGTWLALDLRREERLSGELLAVQHDSVWLLPPDSPMRLVMLRDVTRARVPKPGMKAGAILAWTAIGGLVSGALLTAACGSVEGADCSEVLPVVVLNWALVGGLSAARAGSGWRPVSIDPATLAPYARFPQGLPAGFVPVEPNNSPTRR